MNPATLNVVLIEDDPDYASLIHHWMSASTDTAYALNWTDSLESGQARLAHGGVDIVLLDLGLPDSSGMASFLAVRQSASDLPVIVLSAGDSESLALETIQHGAQDYLVKSSCTGELLLKALRYAHVRHRYQLPRGTTDSAGLSRVIAIVGAKGGAGATTVACNLAFELRELTKQPVLLIDTDVQAGMVAFHMGVEPKYSVVHAIANLDHIDKQMWDTVVTPHRDVDVLASPSLLDSRPLEPGSIERLISFARPSYGWILLDLGRPSHDTMPLLDHATQVLLVTSSSVPALHAAKRAVDQFTDRKLDRDRIRLVLNRPEHSRLLQPGDLDNIFGLEIYARLPADPEGIHKALLGRTPVAAGSGFRKEIASLARKLADVEEPRPKRNIPSFFGFLSSSKTVSEAARVG